MQNVSASDPGQQSNTTSSIILSSRDLTAFREYQAALLIWKLGAPCILLLGTFGNVATVCVMRRIKDHHSSQYAILMALAVSDLCLLYSDTLRMWVYYLFDTDVRLLHRVVCKLHMWLVYSINTTSAWLVTGVTVQRAMAVLWPHRMRVMCTVHRTWVAIALLVLAAFLLHFHIVLGVDIVRGNWCYSGPGLYDYFFRIIFTWVDMCASSFLPCVCLVVCDVILSVTLFRAMSSKIAAPVTSTAEASHSTDRRRKSTSRTTVLVLALSAAFLLFTMPVCVCLIWDGYMRPYMATDPQLEAQKELAYAVTFLLWYTNSAVNFLLYCLTGTKFRGQFSSWIHCAGHSLSAPSVRQVTSEPVTETRSSKYSGNVFPSKMTS